jgi:hypothetical protein
MSAALVRASFGAQFATMLTLESRALCRRGTMIGTAITRAKKQANRATTNSRPEGNTSSARSPGAATTARRPASAFARVCSSA